MRIKEIRTKAKMSQKDLAQKLNILPSTLHKYEKGVTEPNIDMLKKIANELGTSVDYMIGANTPMLDLRKLTDTQKKLVNIVVNLNPYQERQALGYLELLQEK